MNTYKLDSELMKAYECEFDEMEACLQIFKAGVLQQAPKVGDELVLRIEAITHEGMGVAKIKVVGASSTRDFVVFVMGGITGDLLKAKGD